MEAKEVSMRSILSNSNEAYKVPTYQRTYTWDEDQWGDLWNDITQLKPDETHFLGSMVVVPEESHRLGLNNFFIVDGQQRLATVLIFISSIREVAREQQANDLVNHIETLLYAKDLERGKEIKYPKLTLGELDNESFQKILRGQIDKEPHLTFKCYEFFKSKIKDNDVEELSNLLRKILNQLNLVHINAFNYFNAFRLFETLNDRGLALSAADLIKNYLLMKVAGQDQTSQLIFEKVVQEWNEMYEKVREIEPVKYIRRYTLSSTGTHISQQKLYESLKEEIVEGRSWDKPKIFDFVKDLNEKATIYRKIFDCSFEDEDINKFLKKLHLVEIGTSFTLLLKIFSHYLEGTITKKELMRILKMVEVFHIRWGVCGQSTATLDRLYTSICNKLNNEPTVDNSLDIIAEVMGSQINSNADDDLFKRNFSIRSFAPTESRTKYILWMLSSPTGETIIDLNSTETEHIMPKKLSPEWIQYLQELTGLNVDEIGVKHEENLHRIGNLTLIKGEWNRRMSNRLFEEKKEDYKQSEISITSDLTSHDIWDFDEIKRRSDEFALKAMNIWKWPVTQ